MHLRSGKSHGEGTGNWRSCGKVITLSRNGCLCQAPKTSKCVCTQTRSQERLWRPGSVSPPGWGCSTPGGGDFGLISGRLYLGEVFSRGLCLLTSARWTDARCCEGVLFQEKAGLSQRGPWAGITSSTWEHVRNVSSWNRPKTSLIRNSGCGLTLCVLRSPPGESEVCRSLRNSSRDSRSAPGTERAWQRLLASRVSLITKGLKPKSLSFCPFFLLLHHRDHQAISSLTAGVLVLGMGRRRKEGRCCGQLPQRTKAPAVWNAGPFVHSADGWRDSGLRRTGKD